ncbi:MAG: glycolate oxidase subunit GlcE [Methylococcaceae bacterium]|nr:glycolate oxidase subunit GlcE [Methylococcaceae bacterium]
MLEQDLTPDLLAQVQQAVHTRTHLKIVGGNSKSFYGTPTSATALLEVSGHRGIVSYEPSELVVKVRAGTRLTDLTQLLTDHGQMLAFEPPGFASEATIGGTIACGFSGPRRPFAGSARDSVLGCTLINGNAECLAFGGQVMKNVAGFDVSRLMVGALGQLGVLLDISLRVVPMPEAEITVTRTLSSAHQALELMQQWQREPWPFSALVYDGNKLMMRLSGAETAVHSAASQLGGDIDLNGDLFWRQLREQQLDFFRDAENLWRISIAPATPLLDIEGEWLLDWGGAQRWLKSPVYSEHIHQTVAALNGHAVCFRGSDKTDWLRLEPGLMNVHKKIRQAFDPYRLLNPHRFSPEL